MTALRWMTNFDHVHINGTGRVGDVCWMYVHAWNVGEPGETPQYVVVERENGESRARTTQGLTTAEQYAIKTDPLAFWERMPSG